MNPGQTLTVKVTSPMPALFPEVALIGEAPIGFAGTISSLPGEFSVRIPKDIELGKHTLTVEGTTKFGNEPISATIEIDVERPDSPVSMSATLSGIELDSPGEKIPLEVIVQYADGTTYRATSSSHIGFLIREHRSCNGGCVRTGHGRRIRSRLDHRKIHIGR